MKSLLAALVLIGLTATARAQVPTFGQDESYSAARKTLLAQGWRPVHAPDPGFVCDTGDARCAGRPETIACAGTGQANCLFRWKRAATMIEVETIGEVKPVVTGVTCKANCK